MASRIDEFRVRRQLSAILGSFAFRYTPRLSEFLKFVVTETLAGRESQIKEYSIAVNVYKRKTNFDPKLDATVRVEGLKLRTRLKRFYDSEPSLADVVICIPKGRYVPEFAETKRRSSLTSDQIGDVCATGEFGLWQRTREGVDFAREHFSEAVRLDPFDPRGYLGLADSDRSALDAELGEPAPLVLSLEETTLDLLRRFPENCQAHVLRSIALCAAGNIGGEALEQIDEALMLDPNEGRAHFWKGGLLTAKAHHEEAIREICHAIRLVPQSALFRTYLGRVLYYSGQHKAAIETLEEIRRVHPAFAACHLWLTLALIELGKYDEAVKSASQAVSLQKNSASLSCLCYAFARAGKKGEAKALIHRLVALGTQEYVPPLWLASIHWALGELREAFRNLEAAQREHSWSLIWQKVDPRLVAIA